jgi:DNA-binding HxlR family transcriptional regulator
MMFAKKRHFREFLISEEAISSNILADRLASLVAYGLVTKQEDKSHKQKAVYSLTVRGIDLLPVIAQIGIWGLAHRPASKESSATALRLKAGGPTLWRELAAELRKEHGRVDLGRADVDLAELARAEHLGRAV